MTLTQTLDLLGDKIVRILEENRGKKMTYEEIVPHIKVPNYSSFGWKCALEKLVGLKKIKLYGFAYSID